MRFAIIGLGMVSDTHLSALRDLRGRCDLQGVTCRTVERRQSVARTQGVRAYEDIGQIAEDPQVDAVIVLTPPNARREIVERMARAGKHLLLEKPIERSLDAASDLVSLCERYGVRMGVVFQHRFRAAVQSLAGLLESGALGQIAMVRAEVPWWREQSYYDAPGRGTYAQDGGGVLLTQAIHTIDLMRALAGPVQEVRAMTATTALHEMEAEDFASAAMRFASGAVGSLFATTAAFPGGAERLHIDGTRGSALLEGDSLTVRYRDGSQLAQDADDLRGGSSAGRTGGGADPMAFSADWHRALIADFAQSIANGKEPRVSGRDALEAHRLIDAIARASRLGHSVTLGQSA